MKKLLLVTIVVIIALSGCVAPPQEKITPTPEITEKTPVPDKKTPSPTGTTLGGKITFESIDKGSLVDGPINATIFIADGIAEAEKFTKFDQVLSDKISAIDFKELLVITVFQGRMPTGGYEITVKDINQIGEKIRITVALPGPTEGATTQITYPYHAVSINKNLRIVPETIWELYTEDGKVLAQTTYP